MPVEVENLVGVWFDSQPITKPSGQEIIWVYEYWKILKSDALDQSIASSALSKYTEDWHFVLYSLHIHDVLVLAPHLWSNKKLKGL